MTMAPMDFLSGTTCQLVPGLIPWGPGWYLVAANARVEAGPFLSVEDAEAAARWMSDRCYGVHPAPWSPRYSAQGLLIGSRIRERSQAEGLPLAG